MDYYNIMTPRNLKGVVFITLFDTGSTICQVIWQSVVICFESIKFVSGSLTSCWTCSVTDLMSQSVSQVRIFTLHQRLTSSMTVEFSLNIGVNVQLGSWHWRSQCHRRCCICPAMHSQLQRNANYKASVMKIYHESQWQIVMINQLISWQHNSPQWQQILCGMPHNSRTSRLKQSHLGNIVNYSVRLGCHRQWLKWWNDCWTFQ